MKYPHFTIGDRLTVHGIKCRIVAVHDAGSVDAKEIKADPRTKSKATWRIQFTPLEADPESTKPAALIA
jgi:hypothetical protein